MGLLRKLASKVVTRVAGVGSPSSPPVDGRLPAHPLPPEPDHAQPNHAPGGSPPAAADRTGRPWYLDGSDADGWEEVDANVKKPE